MEENRIQLIKRILNQVLMELSNQIYNIDLNRLRCLYDRNKQLQVKITNKQDKEIEYNFYYEKDGEYCGSIKMKNWHRCFLLEYPPQYRNNKLCSLNLILSVANYDDEEKLILAIYHEIAHFLASSEWKTMKTNGQEIIEHKSGICIDKYYYDKGSIYKIESNHIESINEALNDWVSKYLYSVVSGKEQINDKRYEKINKRIEHKIKTDQIKPEQILCYYISNNISRLVEKLNLNDFIINDEKGERN